MTDQDREKWDARWSERAGVSFEPHPLLLKFGDLCFQGGVSSRQGFALDLACGRGQNAIYLAELGYKVTALDISQVALDTGLADAARRDLAGSVHFEQTDLDGYSIEPEIYKLICVIRFLNRRLLGEIVEALKPGGYVIYATRHMDALKVFPESKVEYLLEDGELFACFPDWQVLHYHKGPVEVELIAQKPDIIE